MCLVCPIATARSIISMSGNLLVEQRARLRRIAHLRRRALSSDLAGMEQYVPAIYLVPMLPGVDREAKCAASHRCMRPFIGDISYSTRYRHCLRAFQTSPLSRACIRHAILVMVRCGRSAAIGRPAKSALLPMEFFRIIDECSLWVIQICTHIILQRSICRNDTLSCRTLWTPVLRLLRTQLDGKTTCIWCTGLSHALFSSQPYRLCLQERISPVSSPSTSQHYLGHASLSTL